MTAQKYSDKRVPRHYFAFLLRQNWPALVTNSIVLFLLNVVSLSMSLSEMLTRYSPMNVEKNLLDLLADYRGVNVFFGIFLAILWGCTTMSYLNSKVGVNFHHSLPLTREAHYFWETLTKVVLFVVPLIVSNFLGYLTAAAVSGKGGAAVFVIFAQSVLYAAVYFLLIYGIVVFAASFTGTTFARVLASGMILFMPFILFRCLYWICDYSAVYSNFNWLDEIGERILIFTRAAALSQHDQEISIPLEVVGTLVAAGVFLVLGVLVYKRRKSELSGTPVLSYVARGLMKYSAVFVSATVFAMAMSDFADGFIGIYIGGAIGTVLAVMLMNTILTKSAKKMFAGVRGLVISFLIFSSIFTVLGFDLFGFDSYVPAPSSVRTVTVDIGGVKVELTDRDDVKRVTEIVHTYFQNGLKEDGSYLGTVIKGKYLDSDNMTAEDALQLNFLNETNVMLSETGYIRVSFKTITGLRFEKRYQAPINGSHAEIITTMANAEGFLDAYFGESVNYVGTGWTDMPLNKYSDSQKFSETYARELWYNMRIAYNGIEYFNRPVVATIMLEGTPVYRYPFYDGNEDAIDSYMRALTSVYVVNAKTGEVKEYTDPVAMEAVLRAGVIDEGWASAFTPKDNTYVFFGVLGDKSNYRYISGYFLKGSVPTAVTN